MGAFGIRIRLGGMYPSGLCRAKTGLANRRRVPMLGDRKPMIKDGILNPALLELLARFRHTNTLVIADRGFPFWPQVPTVDLSLVDDVPTVRQVLAALQGRYTVGAAVMAEEFHGRNTPAVAAEYQRLVGATPIRFEPHVEFKKRVPSTIGLVRTGDTTQYGNIILESA